MASPEITSVYIPLEGVESEHCALIVDKGLSEIKLLDGHKVELNNRRALISSSSSEALREAVKAIRGLGYGVTSVRNKFSVLNMTCASCAVSVESIIKSLPGIIESSVNYANATVTVEYLPNLISADEIRKSVQSIGYDLLLPDESFASVTIEELQAIRAQKLRKHTLWSALFTLPVFIIGMFMMNIPYANVIMWIFSTPVVLWFGKDFFVNAFKQARHGMANMDTLVALSTGVAYLFSVFNTLFPEFWQSRGLHAHVYFETAAVVTTFILLGKMLEEGAKGKTSSAIKKLMGLQAKTVTLIRPDSTEEVVEIANVHPGDILIVKPGEKIAVDGEVQEGSSYVDESMISGEPVPVLKSPGAKVLAGTINQKGSFRFMAQKVGSETRLAQIIRLVQDAQGSKAPVQKLVDRISSVFVPVVIITAVLTFLSWWIFGDENGFTQGLMAMITVLVIACPCALGLATPTAIMVGIGKGAEQGILIKDAESLELARKVDAVVLDKTGTITEGKPEVAEVFWKEGSRDLIKYLVSIEKQSEHPLASAIVNYFKETTVVPLTAFESITGKGVRAIAEGRTWFVGNRVFMTENNLSVDLEMEAKSQHWAAEARTVVWFADQEHIFGIIAVADRIKPDSVQAVQQLRNTGIEVYMLTGDNVNTASAVAGATGIKHYKAGMLPDEKAEFVRQLQSDGMVVAMVGDGINDSAALAQADVSIAMGKGSDIAMDVARMTIMSSDLRKIGKALHLSDKTVRYIRQNLFWAFIYNIIGIPLAAGALYLVAGVFLDPMIAGAAMAMSSVSVVGNSLRLKWSRL